MSQDGRVYDPSPQNLRILTGTFWSGQGWRDRPAWPVPEDMRRAVEAGIMFTSRRGEDHDGWVAAARTAAARLTAAEVADGFLASLTSRRLDLRSALGSYAVARLLPEHPFQPAPGDRDCQVCGQPQSWDEDEDMNVLNLAPRLRPGPDDITAGQQLIDQLRQLPGPTTAARAVTHLKMIKGNKDQRDIIIGILGVCGILDTRDHPGYATTFVPSRDRRLPGRAYVDQAYPACWWTAADGISTHALSIFLPQLT